MPQLTDFYREAAMPFTTPFTIFRQIAVLATAAMLAACGGSSGSAPVAATVITSANAPTVAGNAADGALESGEFGDFLGGGLPFGAVPVDGSGKSLAGTVGGTWLPKLIGQISQIPFGPVSSDCAMGGTVTISGDVSGGQNLVAGDRVRAQFVNCDEGNGQVLNGAFELLINSISGDPASGVFSLSVTMTLQALRVMEAGVESSADGAVTLAVDNTAFPIATAATSGERLAMTHHGRSLTLSAFGTTVTTDQSAFPLSWTIESGGRLSSSQFDGQVTYSTPVPFQGSGQANPYAGELLIRGANNASIRLIALDEVNILLELDLDGDGSVDETRSLTWDDIRS